MKKILIIFTISLLCFGYTKSEKMVMQNDYKYYKSNTVEVVKNDSTVKLVNTSKTNKEKTSIRQIVERIKAWYEENKEELKRNN